MPEKWEEIGALKRKALLESIPKEWLIPGNIMPPDSQLNVMDFPEKSGWFTQKELEITNTSAVDLVQKLAKGEWSSEEVTLAFCKRASAAHQLVRECKATNETRKMI